MALGSFAVMAAWLLPAVAHGHANTGVPGVAVCPGEGDRYGDHKCNHDPTHRVCAQLLDGSGAPLQWGSGDFWEITGQEDFKWDAEIRANHGDSWCICMWATAELIEEVGCDNVHLRCEATDISFVLDKYEDGGVDLEPAKACLEQKCPETFMLMRKEGSLRGSPVSRTALESP